ncbi:MAG TPA: AMP-binding protein, partial [Chloroflexota bacterium]|nr:AMP-binding protein [Chloroflexota bacterium]
MTPPPATILDAFIRHADRSPGRLAIRFEGEDYSYSDLENRSNRWAGGFVASGIAPGDRVALCLENSVDFIGAYLGAQRAAASIVPVNTLYRQVELRHIFNDSSARFCIVDEAKLPALNQLLGDFPSLETIVVVGSPGYETVGKVAPIRNVPKAPNVVDARDFVRDGTILPPRPSPEDIALIAYTSGTTGRSKGAMLSHRNLFENSRSVTGAWSWTHRDHLLLTLPLFHIHGLGVGLNGALVTGSSIDLRRRFDPVDVLDTLALGEASMFFGVPTMYARLIAEVKKRDAPPPPIRLYVSGSAPLSADTFREFAATFGQTILERYGMTETVMNLSNPLDGERRPGTVGRPFPGQEARIVDLRSREPIVDARTGEIQVRGPHVFSGYWRQPEATEAAFDPEGWFNTGDLGWRSADGYYTISGR